MRAKHAARAARAAPSDSCMCVCARACVHAAVCDTPVASMYAQDAVGACVQCRSCMHAGLLFGIGQSRGMRSKSVPVGRKGGRTGPGPSCRTVHNVLSLSRPDGRMGGLRAARSMGHLPSQALPSCSPPWACTARYCSHGTRSSMAVEPEWHNVPANPSNRFMRNTRFRG
jgi:hypothetical protein